MAHTIDCECSKMLNHGLNHGLFLSLGEEWQDDLICHVMTRPSHPINSWYGQRYKNRVLQTIQMKLKLLCKEEIS